jgi:hypothetical protein
MNKQTGETKTSAERAWEANITGMTGLAAAFTLL